MTNCELTEKQSAAVLMLFQGMGFEEVAKELGVTVRTLRTWRGLPQFKAHANVLREIAQDAAQDRLRRMATKATTVLESLLDSDDEATQLKAVSMVFDNCPPFPDQHGAIVGSTDPDHFRSNNLLGMPLQNSFEDACQFVLATLEDYVSEAITVEQVKARLEVSMSIEEAENLIADHTKLTAFVSEWLVDDDDFDDEPVKPQGKG